MLISTCFVLVLGTRHYGYTDEQRNTSLPGTYILGVRSGVGSSHTYIVFTQCPGGSDGKESTCNAGDLGSVPGLGRSPGEEDS